MVSVHHKMRKNDVRVGIFVDDRALWATGKGAARRVAEAHRAGRDLDKKFGWGDHPDKRESFASAKEYEDAKRYLEPVAGDLQDEFKLLGVMHRVKGSKYPKKLNNAKAEDIIEKRLHRIKSIWGDASSRRLPGAARGTRGRTTN